MRNMAKTRKPFRARDLNVMLERAGGSRIRQGTRKARRRKFAEPTDPPWGRRPVVRRANAKPPFRCSLNQQTANHPSAALLPTRKPS